MKKTVREYLFIAIGAFFIAAGTNCFLIPHLLSSGGVSTLGTILLHLFGIPLSVTTLAANALLFLFGYRLLGRAALFKTVAGILSLSLFFEVTKYLPAFGEDMLLSSVAGGLLVGVGVGLVVRVGGSTGGSDFAGLMIRRLVPHISVATFILLIDCTVIAVSGIVFGSLTVTFYSVLAMYLSSRVTDAIMNIGDAAKSIYIMSDKTAEIEEVILEKFDRGVTEIDSRGAYTQKEKTMLLCVVTPREAPLIVREVRRLDPAAFIILSDAREVLGEGFKAEML